MGRPSGGTRGGRPRYVPTSIERQTFDHICPLALVSASFGGPTHSGTLVAVPMGSYTNGLARMFSENLVVWALFAKTLPKRVPDVGTL